MTRLCPLLSIFIAGIMCATAPVAHGQSFINGSFEPKRGTITPCTAQPHYVFNNMMANTYISGSATSIILANSTCGQGAAKDSTYFLGLTATNVVILRLSAPLVAHRLYKISFSYKKSTATAACDLYLGYNPLAADSLNPASTYTHIIPGPTSTAWTTVVDTFTPGTAGYYVTFDALSANMSDITYMDDVRLLPTTGVGDVITALPVTVQPNPLSSTTRITLGADAALPCAMALYDMTGRIVREEAGIMQRDRILERGNLPAGMYFLRLRDAAGRQATEKLSIQ